MPHFDDDRPKVRRIIAIAFILISFALVGVLLFAWGAAHRATKANSRADKLEETVTSNKARIDQLEGELRAHDIPVPVPIIVPNMSIPTTSTSSTTTATRSGRASSTTTSTMTRPSTTTTTSTTRPCAVTIPLACARP